MLQFQTLACIRDIPVVRSSTDIIQQTYTKAKDSSVLIRVPCNFAEYVTDKSLQIATTVSNPFVKPFKRPVEAIDNYAAKQIRVMESKYPVITTPTEDVVNSLNAKTETVRNAVSSVKKSTTDRLQNGREAVSNVASATVNKATGVVDSIYGFCETRLPRFQKGKYFDKRSLTGCFSPKSNGFINGVLPKIQDSFNWCRFFIFIFFLRLKQINDLVLKLVSKQKYLALVQRFIISFGQLIDNFAGLIRPDEHFMEENERFQKHARIFPNRDLAAKPNLRGAFPRDFSGSKDSKSNECSIDELHRRLGGKGDFGERKTGVLSDSEDENVTNGHKNPMRLDSDDA